MSTGKWEVEEGPGWIMFTQTVNDPLTGYGYEYRKTLRVTKGRPELAIEHSLKNTGTKPIETVQYNHNFLTLDRATTGPEFAIVTTFPIQVPKPPDPAFAAIRGNEITYTKTLTGEERVVVPARGLRQGRNELRHPRGKPEDRRRRPHHRRSSARAPAALVDSQRALDRAVRRRDDRSRDRRRRGSTCTRYYKNPVK